MDKIYEDGIIHHEKGILNRNGIHFHHPSPFAKDNLICVLWGAEDIYDIPYQVHREYLNAFMLTYIIEGEMHFTYRGGTFIAPPGSIIFQDCKYLNHYWVERRTKAQFIHFTGGITQAYCDMLFEQQGACFLNQLQSGMLFQDLLTELKKAAPNDHQLSWIVTDILRLLSIPREHPANPMVEKAQQYMRMHFSEALSLEDISAHVSLSPYYFSRLFKRETEHSPHQYLLGIRMKHAQTLLSSTHENVDNIATFCGFGNTSHFIRAFKKEAGMTPTSFRKLFAPPATSGRK